MQEILDETISKEAKGDSNNRVVLFHALIATILFLLIRIGFPITTNLVPESPYLAMLVLVLESLAVFYFITNRIVRSLYRRQPSITRLQVIVLCMVSFIIAHLGSEILCNVEFLRQIIIDGDFFKIATWSLLIRTFMTTAILHSFLAMLFAFFLSLKYKKINSAKAI